MVGVKDHKQESLVGQAGEVEPVYDQYALSFFLFDPANKRSYFPQYPEHAAGRPGLEQQLEDLYLPIIQTTYRTPIGIDIHHKVLATTVGAEQRSLVLIRLKARLARGSHPSMLGCALEFRPPDRPASSAMTMPVAIFMIAASPIFGILLSSGGLR